jgi:hypothetical protein
LGAPRARKLERYPEMEDAVEEGKRLVAEFGR